VDVTTWILIAGTVVLIGSLLLYRPIEKIHLHLDLGRRLEQARKEAELEEEVDSAVGDVLDGAVGDVAGEAAGDEEATLRRFESTIRIIMQVFITVVGLAFGLMIVLDGCYAWLGWCQEPATEAAKSWASGIVGTVAGFWLTKA
jgi:hypothetical protein